MTLAVSEISAYSLDSTLYSGKTITVTPVSAEQYEPKHSASDIMMGEKKCF